MININKEDLYWLAGLLEGEGCFAWGSATSPAIKLSMVDLDVVERVRDIMRPGSNIRYEESKSEKHKSTYSFAVYGEDAIEWMRILQPLMFVRRRAKITETLDRWDNSPLKLKKRKEYVENKRIKDAVRSIALSRNISYEEAEKMLSSLLSVNKEVIQ